VADSGKMQELFHILRGIVENREKVLVFFCRRITGDLLQPLVEREFGLKPGLICGSTDTAERERIIKEFRAPPVPGEPQPQVLLLSVWVGAVGLNFPEARWVVHFERVWNPALEGQATGRVHRLTSPLPVKAYCLFTKDSVEEKKQAVLLKKRELSEHIIDALDGNLELNDGDDQELLQMLHGEAAGGAEGDDEEAEESAWLDAAGDGREEELAEELDDDDGTGGARDLYPSCDKLRPRQFKMPLRGKYGDAGDQELWDVYVTQGRREVHPKALVTSTASTVEKAARQSSRNDPRAGLRESLRRARVLDPRP
jgi:superfamily II DNA or RNA helicase